jgi:ABC-type branched-subunit amino acid transport system ATPase component
LLLDEPSMGLSPSWWTDFTEVVQDASLRRCKRLLVEQSAMRALTIANRGYVMDSGLITMAGNGKDMLNDHRSCRLLGADNIATVAAPDWRTLHQIDKSPGSLAWASEMN